MCGIWAIISEAKNCHICAASGDGKSTDPQLQEMQTLHQNRGPDISTTISTSNSLIESSQHHIHLSGHVLWTQGPSPVLQPYTNFNTNLGMSFSLLFNGDIYSFTGGEGYNDASFHPTDANDGLQFFNALTAHFYQDQEQEDANIEDKLMNTIGKLRGPFAFIFVVLKHHKLIQVWFGRDFFGRQSLLFSTSGCGISHHHISSVSVFQQVFEIPAAGIYKWDLSSSTVDLFPYNTAHQRADVAINLDKFSTFLANSCCLSLQLSIKCVNLSFQTELPPIIPDEDDIILRKLVQLSQMNHLTSADMLIEAAQILDPLITQFLHHLRRSVRLRLKAVAPYCKNCVQVEQLVTCPHVRVGVLFSGGLDSTVIAYLAAEALDKVDLLNVAFSKSDTFDNVPDRETGLESYAMLRDIFLRRGKQINLVLVNETKQVVEEMRKHRIKTLISPLKSVIDDSVGCCLWFASRGQTLDYSTPIRTVLIGSGADELLGGYSRHRSSFEKQGWSGLSAEMQFDLDRISIRNMGRDNRVVSDHGLSPRMPYLDEGLIHFLTQNCPTWAKCCPLLGERGLGEKILLRAAALNLFGSQYAKIALFPKRAMQFGSRIAKLENHKEKGGDNCDRLL